MGKMKFLQIMKSIEHVRNRPVKSIERTIASKSRRDEIVCMQKAVRSVSRVHREISFKKEQNTQLTYQTPQDGRKTAIREGWFLSKSYSKA